MEQERFTAEEENVKKMSRNDSYQDIDVKDAVMKRIRTIHVQKAQDEAAFSQESNEPLMQRTQEAHQRQPRFKAKIAVSGVAAALLIAVTGFGIFKLAGDYATPERPLTAVKIIESQAGTPHVLKNSAGQVVLGVQNITQGDTPLPSPSPAALKYSERMNTYRDQVEAALNPGERAVFYVKDAELDKLATGLGYGTKLIDAARPQVYNDYTAFDKAWSEIDHSGIRIPSSLPDGYEFDQGRITDQTFLNQTTPKYLTVLQQLEAEAQADTSGKQVFIRKLEKSRAKHLQVNLDYIKNGAKRSIRLSVSELMTNGSTKVSILSGQSEEKWSIGGKEALFISISQAAGNQGGWLAANRLVYYDQDSNMLYTLSDVSKPLTKNEWLALAPVFIQQSR
ncbi:hypothetical protein [Paenibacillus agri]|uniref:DUF4367 domain-containing protein n=1 Tax=Paenibacillus agri TaxID=2744309 RepID=A0A850EQQ6_9BACL|nr:hypothetical protein [Paenibacillus agri]NUU63538.1 hypothetical protein [Paenibacillus agri]